MQEDHTNSAPPAHNSYDIVISTSAAPVALTVVVTTTSRVVVADKIAPVAIVDIDEVPTESDTMFTYSGPEWNDFNALPAPTE